MSINCNGGPSETQIHFTINNKSYQVKRDEVPVDTSLNTYIRDYANLTGTKFMCKEGGCGACLVAVTSRHPFTGKPVTYAVNSCLFKVWSCANAEVTTIEKAKDFKYPGAKLSLSDQLATKNGTQCGYCSPGMVMNMYGLIKGSTDKLQAPEVEFGFAGNICRCTGYKPILEAFKSTVDPSSVETMDIEDAGCAKKCSRRRMISDNEEAELEACFLECALAPDTFSLNFKDGRSWNKPKTVKEVLELFDGIKGTYMLINGNTAQGVSPAIFRDQPVQNYIDVRGIKELRQYSIDNNGIKVGANITINDFIRVLKEAQTKGQFKYASELAEHLSLVANQPVRNTGTLAGNLMLKYAMYHQPHPQMFQSDVFLLLELVNAQLSIKSLSGQMSTLTPSELMETKSMDRQIIVQIALPPLDSNVYMIRTYKIMPRAQNAPAAVNAGFLFKMNASKPKVIDEATVVYGGINPSFVHATNTQSYLKGKDISDENVLQSAIDKVKEDLNNIPDGNDYLYPSAYRLQLSVNLLYKTFLYLNKKKKTKINPSYISGSQKLECTRSLSNGYNNIKVPVDKARGKLIPKLEAFIQCKGEAEYVNDIPVIPGQLYAAMVIAPSGPGTLNKIDYKEAQSTQGFVKFLSVGDIPGKNSLFITNKLPASEAEELFCSGEVKYAGQPVGVVVAKSQDQANAAARKVKVSVNNTTPLSTIDSVLDKYKQKYPNERIIPAKMPQTSSFQQETQEPNIDSKGLNDDYIRVNGEFNMGSQYHYTMELQTCAVVPVEDDQYDVFSSSQWPQIIQEAVSLVLGVMDAKVNVVVRRVGGAYGCKVSRAVYAAAACAVASENLKKPVRMVMDLETNTKAIGKRCSLKCFYDIAVDKTGKIMRFDKLDFLDDKGITLNDPIFFYIPGGVQNCYDIKDLLKPRKDQKGNIINPFNVYSVKTDTPSSSWCRAPGTLEGMTVIETIMNAIADRLSLDPVQVRLNNINQTTNKPFYDYFVDKAKEINHTATMNDIKKFNETNRWVKRGYSIIPMSFPIDFFYQFYCTVSVHEGDGSISISHGGTEIGQGINTKVAVAAAYIFGLDDVSLISVKPTRIAFSPNNMATGGSMTSDATSYACMKCCKAIKARLQKLIEDQKLPTNMKWPDLIKSAYLYGINLHATFMWKLGEKPDADLGPLNDYSVSGVCGATVEVDILTGQHIIRQVTLNEDVGKSFAPAIDLGQVQGAFVMGLGYFTSEEIIYSKDTGELITNRTWNYDVPGALDIPETFNVTIENDPNLGGKPGTKPDYGVMGAKATGEPPLCLSSTVFFAIKEAIKSARKNARSTDTDFKFDPPATIAQKVLASNNDDKQFKIIN